MPCYAFFNATLSHGDTVQHPAVFLSKRPYLRKLLRSSSIIFTWNYL